MEFKFIAKENVSNLPKSPGVYAFKKGRQILYIGKATNIKERIKNHFQQPGFRSNLFVNQADKIGYIKTDSEFADPTDHLTSRPASQGSTIEALILEAKLIKKYQPKYNVMWRDDKNYFYVGIAKDDFPRVFVTHQPQHVSRVLYPVSGIKSKKIRNTKYKIQNTKFVGPFVDGHALKQALNVLRRIFPYRTCKPYSGRPCLWYQLGRCPGPCLLGSKLAKEMPGREKAIKKESQRNIRNLKNILEGGKNQALKNLKREMKNASKIRDFERAAKIRDQIWALERILSHSKILDYPSEAKGEEERMFFDRSEPETSRKRRSPDSRAWKEIEKDLKKVLKAKGTISRIEAYDVSNMQGQNATGSMVTFINGEPNKNFYRRFKIKISGKPNDIAMIKEILSRRFQHSEWGFPDLILIDGGRAHLNTAIKTKSKDRKAKNISVIALAKKRSVAKPRTKLRFGAGENKLFVEGKKGPILLKTLPREIFNLILQLRDEAHRFAIAYHKKLREDFRGN